MKYISLVNYTEYSLKRGCMKVPSIVKQVKKFGMNAVGITEVGNMFSAMEFYKTATTVDKEKNPDDSPIKPIIGLRAFINDSLNYAHVLCKNLDGYSNIIKVLTNAQLHKVEGMPVLDINALDRNNLFILSGDMISSILLLKKNLEDEIAETESLLKHFQTLSLKAEKMARLFSEEDKKDINKEIKRFEVKLIQLNKRYEIEKNILEDALYSQAVKKAKELKGMFGANFYIELQNHKTLNDEYVLPLLVKVAEEVGIEVVATNETYYLKKEDKKAKDLLNAIDQKTTINDKNFKKDNGEHYFKSEDEMIALFKDYPKAIENTLKIAEECNLVITKRKHFPKFELPKGETSESYLRHLALEGAKKKITPLMLNNEEKRIIMDRINYELGVINKLGFSEYLLIVSDFCAYGRKVGMLGPGRGSAVGSLVAYLIDITDVNPMPYALFFERFLNEDRVSDPDWKVA